VCAEAAQCRIPLAAESLLQGVAGKGEARTRVRGLVRAQSRVRFAYPGYGIRLDAGFAVSGLHRVSGFRRGRGRG
jgi:hypothetical protein